jgi:mannose-6-phosphate isomerase
MESLYLLNTVLKDYEWGSKTLIPELCGFPVSEKPIAELWMGVHAGGMSTLADGKSLKSFLSKVPPSFLSIKEDKKQLDFLFKVLSAQKALSIQIHPTTEQAIYGFQEEEERDVPLTAPERTYKDKANKAEIIYALSDFWALVGIRPVEEIIKNLTLLKEVPFWGKWVTQFREEGSRGSVREFCYELHTYKDIKGLIEETLPHLEGKKGDLEWIHTLLAEYGEDIGIFSPLWMNVVSLSPGESLFVEPTQIHAYLKGLGLELMVNSDNVIRASLTQKFKDFTEFMRIATFEPKIIEKLVPLKKGSSIEVISDTGADFALEHITFKNGLEVSVSTPYLGIGIALGDVELKLEETSLSLKKGQTVLIKASHENLRIKASQEKDSFFIATWQS